MSDSSDDNGRQSDKEQCICKDFVRGICDRKYCKYKHENETKQLNFCHDFQNNTCTRPHCKFIHCTPEEVEEYKSTGQMSPQIIVEASRKNQLPGSLPICKEFKKGLCRRKFCRYRHITKEQEEAEILEMLQNHTRKNQIILTNANDSQLLTIGSLNGTIRRNGLGYDEYIDDGPPLMKRRFIATQESELMSCDILEPNRPIFRGYFAGNPPSPMVRAVVDARLALLEKENGMLHKEIAQLKRQVSDLTATNEFLLDQNANLRVSGKRNGAVTGAVTITAPSTPAQQRQVIASVATVPVSLATVSTIATECPTVSIATPQQQLLATSNPQILVTTNPTSQIAIANSNQAQLAIAQQNLANNLAQQAQPQQLALAATATQQLTSQAQHMANQQIALASAPQQLTTSQAQQLANQQLTSQAQQLALASTNQQFTIASVPQQLTLAGSNQPLLAQQNLATNQQLELHRNNQINAINTSQTIAMSNATQPMVSYPIMTQQTITHALSH